MEENNPKLKGAKETYTNALIEIMKAPQEAQGVILIALMHKCLYINEIPPIIKQEEEFIAKYTLEKFKSSDNPIIRLTLAAIQAKKEEE